MKRAEVIILILMISISLISGCIFPEPNLPPEPSLRASSTYIDVGEAVIFSANESFDKDGKVDTYYWDFDDGTNSTDQFVSHEYEKGGNYTVILIITDNDGKKAVQTLTIHVNELPKPAITMSSQVYIHETAYFWANNTYDPDGYIKDYFWDFGDGESATGHSVTHTYSEKATFNVTLTVTDNDGAKNATLRVFQVKYRTYKVEWKTSDTAIELLTDAIYSDLPLLEERSDIFGVTISLLNITKLVFDLQWEDDIFPPSGNPNDFFTINVTSPQGYYFQGGPDSDEHLVLNVPKTGILNQIPNDIEAIEAESENILEKKLALNNTGINGTGEWTINITLVDAWGLIGDPGDIENSWGPLMISAYYYAPVITRK